MVTGNSLVPNRNATQTAFCKNRGRRTNTILDLCRNRARSAGHSVRESGYVRWCSKRLLQSQDETFATSAEKKQWLNKETTNLNDTHSFSLIVKCHIREDWCTEFRACEAVSFQGLPLFFGFHVFRDNERLIWKSMSVSSTSSHHFFHKERNVKNRQIPEICRRIKKEMN